MHKLTPNEKVDYFFGKSSYSERRGITRNNEYERKLLNVDIPKTEKLLEKVGCMEVFRGVVNSFYYTYLVS